MKRQYTIYNICVLLALLFLGGGWNVAWGQAVPDKPTDDEIKELLKNNNNGNNFFNSYIINDQIDFETRSEQGIRNEATYVYDIVWTIYDYVEPRSEWPDGVDNESSSSYSISNSNTVIEGNATHVIYAKPNNVKTLSLQDGGGADNLDGFIRWYVTDDPSSSSGGSVGGLVCSGAIEAADQGKILNFSNGLAWLRGTHRNSKKTFKACLMHEKNGGDWYLDQTYTRYETSNSSYVDDTSPVSISSVHYTVPSTASAGDIIYVVCEASARNNVSLSGSMITSPKISVKSVFEIHVLGSDDDRFDGTAKDPFEGNNLKADAIANPENYFLEHFEIHTPVRTGTNYRLSEPLGNYYVPNQGDFCWVQWRMFDSAGNPTDGIYNGTSQSTVTECDKNILKYTFPFDDPDQQYIYYIVASIGYSTYNTVEPSTWYPVSFMKVYLEPFTRPLTASELRELEEDNNKDYQFRYDSYLEENKYYEVYGIPFEKEGEIIPYGQVDVKNNTRTEIIENMRSSYAFIDLGIGGDNGFQYRRNNRLSAGRGEFGLYRTLNVQGISKGTFQIHGQSGTYNDWFASHGYDVEVMDRTWEKTNGTKSGYFMYLDATDEPGIITKIDITNLCPRTTLLVSAWICDLAEKVEYEHADIDFTLKRLIGEGPNQTEETLYKFYSGIVTNKPAHDELGQGNDRAQWQQVAFQFTFEEGTYEDHYVLEISNNAPRSSGADYAIDDIMVYKSTPRIDVERMDACDGRTLTVNTNYETVLANMGWTAGENVPASENRPDEYAKYGYGLPGDSYGNIYFAFLEGLREDEEGRVITVDNPETDVQDVTDLNYAIKNETTDNLSKEIVPRALPTTGPYQYRWVRANRNLTTSSAQSVYSFRVIVSTNKSDIPRKEAEALANEKKWNFNAVLEYNQDVKDGKVEEGTTIDISSDKTIVKSGGLISSKTLNENTITETQYDEHYQILIEELYSRLRIPRIRCPWFQTVDREERLYLYEMDVAHTDLMYAGEPYLDEEGNQQEASGKYHVMVFSGQQISGYPDPKDVLYSEISGACSMVSGFTVYGSAIIRVDTETDANTLACAGTQRTITSAELINLKNGQPLEGVDYNFDWYLGAPSEYNQLLIADMDLKEALQYFRDNENETVTSATVGAWTPENDDEIEIKEALLELLDPENPRLVISQKEDFRLPIYGDSIVAMPYVNQAIDEETKTLYCTEITGVEIPQFSEDVPILHPGYTLEPFEGEVSLRLGHPNMGTGMSLNIPLQKGFSESMAERADRLGISDEEGVNISLNNIELKYPPVGIATSLNILKGTESVTETPNATITITLNEEAKKYLKEGQQYELLIPFVQYDGDEALSDECSGQIVLPVKIVPEYLTWKGGSTDSWYDESKWNQSTKGELYFEDWNDNPDKDANGPDEDLTKAFSPLYFTKITIPEGKELALFQPGTTEEGGNTFLKGWSTDGSKSDSIRYEMAVADENGKILPYYINKVDQIYFKPEASLYRQDHLTYEKAWVDFEMKAKNTPYWMSAPLKGVYAGDMYAPSSNGRQETEAFTDIYYNGIHEDGTDLNSRWNPAFYQKAWDKAIRYAAADADDNGVPTDAEIANVNAVKSNWSIEYNDVTVPYSLGKGFYSKVEKEGEGNVLVRLPKADMEYKYETKTRALTNTRKQPGDYGRLADGFEISIDLSKEDTETTQEEVDGNGTHFLVGNPYMTYLDMKAFFDNNPNLNRKFWTLDRNAGSIVVGTPDISGWSGNDVDGYHDHTDKTAQSYVAPMTAFFVELNKDATTKTIKFTTAMMAAKPTTTDNVYTKSYSASNPILTLTAERGETRSVARLLTSDKGHDEYEASEDAVLLLDSELDAPMVYTVAGDVAAQFNTLRSIKNVPLGIYNKKGDEVTLTISGLSRLVEPLYLYDAWTGKSKELTGDSYQLTVEGESLGRYYLRNEALASELESTISIYSLQPGEIVAASSGAALRQVRVYSVNGELVTQRSAVGQTACRLSVPRGAIYMIYAEDTKGNSQSVKLRVR